MNPKAKYQPSVVHLSPARKDLGVRRQPANPPFLLGLLAEMGISSNVGVFINHSGSTSGSVSLPSGPAIARMAPAD